MPGLIPILALTFAVLSLIIACASLYACVQSYKTAPRKVIHKLAKDISEMDDDLATLQAKYKKMSARYAGLQSNGKNQYTKDPETPNPGPDAMQEGETPAQWKQRMRLRLHRGEISHS